MFHRMTLRSRLVLSFVMVALGSAVVGGFGLSVTGKLIAANAEIGSHALPSLRGIATLEEGLTEMRFATAKGVAVTLEGRDEKVPPLWGLREKARASAQEGVALYASLPRSPEEQALWNKVEPAFRDYVAASDKVWDAIRNHDANQANVVEDEFIDEMQNDLLGPLRNLAELQMSSGARVARDSQSIAKSTRVLLWTVMIVTLVVAISFGFKLALSVARPLAFLVDEARRLRDSVLQGKLAVRADTARLGAEFRPVIEGMNETMDAFMKPIRVTAEYVDRIARGELPEKITEQYDGDFNLIKQNLNTCIDAVGALAADAIALSSAAVDGKLTTRADAARHHGDYARIMHGVNATLDAVMGPMDEATQVLEKLAGRNLKARMEGEYRGDHARVKEALNATAAALHEAIAQFTHAVEQVSSASSQIASSSQAVASGASEQASALEETSTSLGSMASTTKQAADSAQQANGLAQQAKVAAAEGRTAMEQMTRAMGRIKASAEGTSQIIKDINEIAFQTNLLALNAAVEAARAGEAGRGFAVVAEEVRSLALRSKEAAYKTEELIRQAVSEAGEGEVTSKHVQDKLAEITGSVMRVSDIVAEIAAAAREQSAGIDQVTRAVAQMNQVTQQNAASSQESSSAAAELSGQAEKLAAMAATFQVARDPEARRTATAAPAGARLPKIANGRSKPSKGTVLSLAPAQLVSLEPGPGLET